MKNRIKYVLSVLAILAFSVSLSSCDEDDWFYDGWWENGGWNDDRRAEEVISGRWYVDYCRPISGRCPYWESDEFTFYSNGRFRMRGGDGIEEEGRWFIENRYLYVDLDFDGRADLNAYIGELYRDFVTLEVRDYFEHSEYYMEMVR